ncbi:hypothetical protein FNV43_RR13838 [Rhamnella rubrinervis]|uniref:Wall-associated receptor kinase galacturonan-binding domain-containing protein n=1 Tax=Rhamnella rubrinervis TaxID=2594499 RepID=A0A8K0H251_9ROSA|nr:hypothetical protein FNV43_RR13838 [Rhamnella rubrinervis]
MVGLLIVGVVLLSWLMMSEAASGGTPIAKSGCQTQCGNVTIPYPFGIGAGCFLDKWFEIICTRENTTPFLSRTKLEVIDISLQGSVRVRNPITFWNCNKETKQSPSLEGSPFVFSQKNMFTAVGCGAFGLIMTSSYVSTNIAGCMSICGRAGTSSTSQSLKNHSCNGVNCCQTNIPLYLNAFNTSFYAVDAEKEKACKYAFLVDQEWFVSNLTSISAIEEMASVPVVLDWELYYTAIDVFGFNVDADGAIKEIPTLLKDAKMSHAVCWKHPWIVISTQWLVVAIQNYEEERLCGLFER